MDAPPHTAAVAPDRTHDFESDGARLCVYEWGDPTAPPLLLTHGLWDTARGFDLLAPHFSDAYRVVAADARGHGNSDWDDGYWWQSDVRDIGALMEWIGEPVDLLGHSRGGGTAMDAAVAFPHSVKKLINIDGFGPPEGGFRLPGEDAWEERDRAERCGEYLDECRVLQQRDYGWRPYPSFDALVERRARQNPRLSEDWMRYFGFHCARETEDGWVWKVDPMTRMGFGPFDPDWIAPSLKNLRAPMLAITGDTPDAWGPCDETTLSHRLRFVPDWQRATVAEAGHFVHMERPAETAAVVRAFLAGEPLP
ncbi:MAG: alpha/beta hydrolase [Myxococcota bacterium]|nr:alpha/beta hydrolase [Myxococcota bacterium]